MNESLEIQRVAPQPVRVLSTSAMPTSLKDFPPEIFEIILSHIPPVDYLKVKLVSKSFSDWASAVFKWGDMTKGEVVQGQTSLEASLPRTRRLKHFICTHCGLVKPTSGFSDHQAVKTNYKRICISCGIGYNRYTKRQLPKINGEKQIPCWHCRKAVPKYENWEEVLASGKADLTMVLEGYRTEGIRQRYIAGDGRTLDWAPELQLLAFCKPCLELMMRHKKAESRIRQ